MRSPRVSPDQSWSMAKRYGLSVLLVLFALLVTLLLGLKTWVTPPFFLAIMLSAWVGGVGPGLTAALVATLTLNYLFVPPKYSLRFELGELPQLPTFFLSAVVVSVWSAARKRAETLLQRTNEQLKAEVAWDYRSAARSSRRMGGGCGQQRMATMGRPFNSPCPPMRGIGLPEAVTESR